MKIGEKILYNGNIYYLFHIYTSGYCEIKDLNGLDVKLVKLEQIKIIDEIA